MKIRLPRIILPALQDNIFPDSSASRQRPAASATTVTTDKTTRLRHTVPDAYEMEQTALNQRNITTLPAEILLHIFSYLRFEHLLSTEKTCKQFHNIIDNSDLKESAFLEKTFPHLNRKYLNKYALSIKQNKSLYIKRLTRFPLYDTVNMEKIQRRINSKTIGAHLYFQSIRQMVKCPAFALVKQQEISMDGLSYFTLSHCGSHILTSHDSSVRILSMDQDGQWRKQVIIQHPDRVMEAKFSPSASRLLSFSMDGTLQVWGIDDNNEGWVEKAVIHHSTPIKRAKLSPADDCVLSWGKQSSEVQIWGAVSKRGRWCKKTTITLSSPIHKAKFNFSGRYILCYSLMGEFSLWGIDGSGCWIKEQIIMEDHTGHHYFPRFNAGPKEQLFFQIPGALAVYASNGARQWHLESIMPNNRYDDGRLKKQRICFSPSEKHMLTIDDGNTVIRSKNELGQWPVQGTIKYDDECLFQSSGEFSSCGNHAFISEDCTVHIWSLNNQGSWSEAKKIQFGKFDECIEFSECCLGGAFIMIATDKQTCIYGRDPGDNYQWAQLKQWQIPGDPLSPRDSSENLIIICSDDEDGKFHLVGRDQQGRLGKEVSACHGEEIYSCAIDPAEKFLVTGSDSSVCIWAIEPATDIARSDSAITSSD